MLYGEEIEKDLGQFLGYFPSQKRITFSFQSPIIPNIESFVGRFAAKQKIVNFTFSNHEYLDSENYRPFFSPPQSNLLEAPCYSNQREHYIEGVSAEMWFGEAFWQYASCTQDDILSADWLEVEERTNHLYVKAWPEPFNTAEGEQGKVQRRLLKLLFDIG